METGGRILQLETQLAFLEHQYDQLNQVVVQQGRRLARLEADLHKASLSLRSMEVDRIRANQQPPPHYLPKSN